MCETMKAKLISLLLLPSLLLSITLFTNLYSQETRPHKIIYLVSGPRSLSVAFTRMMYARGDFEIFHEPSLYAYTSARYPEFASLTYAEDGFKSFEEVKRAILAASIKNPVFVKEISSSAAEFIAKDAEFMQNEQVHFVFLARNPHHSTISFYKKIYQIPPDFPHLIGLEPLYQLYTAVKEKAKHPPIVILSEDLYSKPEKTVDIFCKMVGIKPLPHALSWENLGAKFDGKSEWHDVKKTASLAHWHGRALQSEGFRKPASYEVDVQGEPTFSEVQDPKHRQACREAWKHNLPYYIKFKNEAGIHAN